MDIIDKIKEIQYFNANGMYVAIEKFGVSRSLFGIGSIVAIYGERFEVIEVNDINIKVRKIGE